MKLIITEHNHATSRLLAKHFSNLGYEPTTAATQKKVWSMINHVESWAWHLLVLDRYLADGDSLTLVRRVRSFSDIPILMLSVMCETSEISRALNDGVDDYLIKPFNLDELTARVKALLRRGQAMRFRSTTLPAERGQYDLRNRVFLTGDKPVALTKSECQILSCLLLHKGSIVSKQLLMLYCSPQQSHAVNTHILNLRNKLRQYITITTIPHQGFIIEQ